MPQMSPMNWLSMFFIFILTMLMFNIVNYFSFTYKNKELSKPKKVNKKFNWKW